MITARKGPEQIVAEKGLQQISDVDQLAAVAREIIAANPKQVEQFRKGKTATLGWFVGQVMKATRGQANAQMVQEVLKKELG
jgi:aspartyl-tRNA(Asn)/glutamyl-tRNA(Gln) amidotransferase subunit B